MKLLLASILSVLTGSMSFAEIELSSLTITSISLFRNEVQVESKNHPDIKIGTKLKAQSAANHKCLLIVTRVSNKSAYADASQCPGFATLKKGQTVFIAGENEVNEEVRVLPRYSQI